MKKNQHPILRILGVDPGSRITGYGLIDVYGQDYRYVASGCIRIQSDAFPERLKEIYVSIDEVIAEYQPTIAAVEQVFVKLNVGGALKLGQARGAAICACVMRSLEVNICQIKLKKQLLAEDTQQKIKFNIW